MLINARKQWDDDHAGERPKIASLKAVLDGLLAKFKAAKRPTTEQLVEVCGRVIGDVIAERCHPTWSRNGILIIETPSNVHAHDYRMRFAVGLAKELAVWRVREVRFR